MWAQFFNAVIGLWLMVAPGLWGFNKTVADNDHVAGPVIVTFAITALFESTRPVRKFNIPVGLWLLAAPWIWGYDNAWAIGNDLLAGLLVIAFSLVKGNVKSTFGGGWSSLWQANSLHEQEAAKRNGGSFPG